MRVLTGVKGHQGDRRHNLIFSFALLWFFVGIAVTATENEATTASPPNSTEKAELSPEEVEIRETKLKIKPYETEESWFEESFHALFDTSLSSVQESGEILRIQIADWNPPDFVRKIEEQNKVVMILGAQDDWPAKTEWTMDKLVQRFGNVTFKVGADDEGQDVNMTLKSFAHYVNTTKDDIPLYIFDHFGEDPLKKSLLDDYKIPKVFTEDLFSFIQDPDLRPPFRWLVIGSARSGTGIHTDPLDTSAWNALISGHKRWVLFPPDTPKHLLQLPKENPETIKNNNDEDVEEENDPVLYDNDAVLWFQAVYPLTKLPTWPIEFKPIELVQKAGETIFVPGGWPHIVLNLDLTVAVTQNFCSRTNFPAVWMATMAVRPDIVPMVIEEFQRENPRLAQLAVLLHTLYENSNAVIEDEEIEEEQEVEEFYEEAEAELDSDSETEEDSEVEYEYEPEVEVEEKSKPTSDSSSCKSCDGLDKNCKCEEQKGDSLNPDKKSARKIDEL